MAGFVADPGTNFSVNQESTIAQRLAELAQKLGVTIYGISGYRSPAHSVSVGGSADDPHTKGEAADIGVNGQTRVSAASITDAELASVGLYRPFDTSDNPSNAEVNHVQLMPSTYEATAAKAIYWAVELKNGTIGIVESATKPSTKSAVMIKGSLTQDNVGTAVNQLPNAGQILAGRSRGAESLLAINGAGAIASAKKTGTGVIDNAKTSNLAALAALGVFATGFAALGVGAAAGGGAAAADGEEDAASGAGGTGSSALNAAKDAEKLAGTATVVGLLEGWGVARILEVIVGAVLLLIGLRSFVSIASGGRSETIVLPAAAAKAIA